MDNDIANVIELAYLHSNNGDHDIAIDILRDALDIHPNNLMLRTTLGIIFARAHRDTESEKVLKSVLRRDPYHVEATSALGRLLDNSLRSQESEQLFRKFLKAKPQCHTIVMDLSRMLLEDDRIDEAFSIAKSHIEENAENLEAYTPLRQLLLLEETRLEDNMLDSDYKPKDWESLVSNLIEQYELIKELQQIVIQDGVDSEFIDLIQDDLIRLRGSFEELEFLLKSVKGKTSKQIKDRMKKAKLEISKLQKSNKNL